MGQGGGNNCTENADCINTPESFDCECQDGFNGNGFISCSGILLILFYFGCLFSSKIDDWVWVYKIK